MKKRKRLYDKQKIISRIKAGEFPNLTGYSFTVDEFNDLVNSCSKRKKTNDYLYSVVKSREMLGEALLYNPK